MASYFNIYFNTLQKAIKDKRNLVEETKFMSEKEFREFTFNLCKEFAETDDNNQRIGFAAKCLRDNINKEKDKLRYVNKR